MYKISYNTYKNIYNSMQHNGDVSPESCKQLQLARSSHCLAVVEAVSQCCTWYKNVYTIWEYTVSKCELGPIDTLLLILLFPAMNYFVGLFNCPSRSIVQMNWRYCSLCVVVSLRWTRTVGPTCTLLLILPPCPFTPIHNNSTIFLILIERDETYFDTSVFLSYICRVW